MIQLSWMYSRRRSLRIGSSQAVGFRDVKQLGGLLLMRLFPALPPDEAMYARIQWWEANVTCLAQLHRTGRTETSCPSSAPVSRALCVENGRTEAGPQAQGCYR
jgi:hypothetical protein